MSVAKCFILLGILRRVTIKLFSRYSRKLKRWARKRKLPTLFWILLCIGLVLAYAYHMNTRRLSVDPSTYTPLLSLIGAVESNNNYNAYYANPRNSTIKFTDMTLNEVMRWQLEFVAAGNPSSAVGRYQIISTTLNSLMRELSLDPNQKFDQKMQDRMAIALLERRGSSAYVNNELTAEELAASLAKEWAALPKVIGENPESSYYAGDGLNASRVDPAAVIAKVKLLAPR